MQQRGRMLIDKNLTKNKSAKDRTRTVWFTPHVYLNMKKPYDHSRQVQGHRAPAAIS